MTAPSDDPHFQNLPDAQGTEWVAIVFLVCILVLFGVVPMMFVLPYFHRAFFLLTGRIYLGPLVMVLVFITILLSNSVTYLPL